MNNTAIDQHQREEYPAAPLRFVALEIQFGFSPMLATDDSRALVYERLRDELPITETQSTLEVSLGPNGPLPPQHLAGLRLLDSERQRSITIVPTSITVQTSVFNNYPEFAALVRRGLEALSDRHVVSVQRIGIRYVDEIRVPGVVEPSQWQPYINHQLLGMVEFGSAHFKVEHARGHLGMSEGQDRHVIFRFGPSNQPAVDPNGPLRLQPVDVEEGHIFTLDVDSFWLDSESLDRELDANEILDTCALLDETAQTLFEDAITDRLRDEVLRKDQH